MRGITDWLGDSVDGQPTALCRKDGQGSAQPRIKDRPCDSCRGYRGFYFDKYLIELGVFVSHAGTNETGFEVGFLLGVLQTEICRIVEGSRCGSGGNRRFHPGGLGLDPSREHILCLGKACCQSEARQCACYCAQ